MKRDQVLIEIVRNIRNVRKSHPVRVAIDGVDAAGKTILGDELALRLTRIGRHVIRASVEGFHNPRAIRYRRGNTSPEGYYLDSFDYPAMIRHLLAPLGPGGNLQYCQAIFDYRIDAPVDTLIQEARADSILICDGIFMLRPELRHLWDLSIFVKVNFDVVLERAIHRLKGADEVYELEDRYRKRYIPGQRIYLRSCLPEQRANIVLENNDLENPTLHVRRVERSNDGRDLHE